MRQAFIVKNPKWEPFTAVSDAFKAFSPKEKDSAVLVVRGRCKEKNAKNAKSLVSGKTAEWLKTQGKEVVEKLKKAAAALVVLVAFTAAAQDNLTQKLTTTTVTNAQTVSDAAGGTFAWRLDQVAVFQLSVTGTNAAATNGLRADLDCSDNGTDWKTAQVSISAPGGGAGTGTSITKLTNSIGATFWRVGSLVNSNVTTVTIPRFTYRPKE